MRKRKMFCMIGSIDDYMMEIQTCPGISTAELKGCLGIIAYELGCIYGEQAPLTEITKTQDDIMELVKSEFRNAAIKKYNAR